jgi:hypothetical protein
MSSNTSCAIAGNGGGSGISVIIYHTIPKTISKISKSIRSIIMYEVTFFQELAWSLLSR